MVGCFAGLGYGLADFGGFAGGWISGGLLEFGFGGGLWFLFGFGGCAFADCCLLWVGVVVTVWVLLRVGCWFWILFWVYDW